VHGKTAAEVICSRADSKKPQMGLTTWKNSPNGPVRKADVTVAKNYLTEEEITELNRIVTMYLDYAEDQARKKQPMHMRDWIVKLNAFLRFNERGILTDSGKVSHALAEQRAHLEYEKYDARRLAQETAETISMDALIDETRRVQKLLPSPPHEPSAQRAKPRKRNKKGGPPLT
jgi:hypothetical protein